MYQSPAKGKDARPIEEVLPAAINATATSAKGSANSERQKASVKGGELARGQSPHQDDEPTMAVMKAGSLVLKVPRLSSGTLVAASVLVLALIVLAVVLL